MNRDLRLAGAEFLEAAADLYALVPFSDQLIGSKNQVILKFEIKFVLRIYDAISMNTYPTGYVPGACL